MGLLARSARPITCFKMRMLYEWLSLVIRYHRASGVVHQQLKLSALATLLNGGLIVADQLSLDRYSHWLPSMSGNIADGMDEALG